MACIVKGFQGMLHSFYRVVHHGVVWPGQIRGVGG